MNIEQSYIDIYKKYEKNIRRNCSEILNEIRDEAFASFQKLGLPSSGENYRYTNLQESYQADYGININRLKVKINPYNIFQCDVPGINAHLFFVVNDTYYSGNEKEETLPEGVIVGSLNEIAKTHPKLVENYFGKQLDTDTDGNQAFNASFAQDGFFLYVPENVHIKKPIQLINIMRANKPLMAISHNLIILGKGAKVQMLVCDHAMDDINFLSNRITEVFVEEGASYEHYKVENTHEKMTNISTLLIDQKKHSNVLANVITLNNGLTRNNIQVDIDGVQAEATVTGLVIADKQQHVDNTTFINHIKPESKSIEIFKYVLDEQSTGVFSGQVLVNKNAQKTISNQTNKNICLTKTAKMNTKPQLEIYADDVKCSHGATIGQLDESAMFYLQSRGISEAESRLLLMSAFVNDVIEHIQVDALKDRIRMLVEKRLRRELSVCSGCLMCK